MVAAMDSVKNLGFAQKHITDKVDILEQDILDFNPDILNLLLQDKTTGKYIIWATDNYVSYGDEYSPIKEIKPELIIGNNTNIIQPRTAKSLSEQLKRTREKAEVFTPSWLCNQQNNLIDDAWFGTTNNFNILKGTEWEENPNKIQFPIGKNWMTYVEARRLEISCGEAPYLVSRYDTVTGAKIPLNKRIGLLDRKLRIINENTSTKADWQEWVIKAYQSIYGYEYQGDNVLLARENLLCSFFDYYRDRFNQDPDIKLIKKIVNIIAWNIWQMDGLNWAVPYYETKVVNPQMVLFDINQYSNELTRIKAEPIYCKIFDWQANKSILFKAMCIER